MALGEIRGRAAYNSLYECESARQFHEQQEA